MSQTLLGCFQGNLLFANVVASDARGGRQYVCTAQNVMMNKIERVFKCFSCFSLFNFL